MPVFFEPLFLLLVVGHILLHEFPKAIGMVHFEQVGEFVQDDIILHLARREQEPGGEVYVGMTGAAAPVGMIVFEVDAADGLAEGLFVHAQHPFAYFRQKITGDHARKQGFGHAPALPGIELWIELQKNGTRFMAGRVGRLFFKGNFQPVLALAYRKYIAAFALRTAHKSFAQGRFFWKNLLFHPVAALHQVLLNQLGVRMHRQTQSQATAIDAIRMPGAQLQSDEHRNGHSFNVNGGFYAARLQNQLYNDE